MITLAAGGGDLVFLIAMLVFGAINWLANKSKEGQQPKNPAPTPRAPKPQRPEGADPEAERMRRFLEALGVPGDAAPAPAPKPVVRPQQPRRPRAQKPKQSAPPPLPPTRSLDEAEAPAAPVADLRVPELTTPALPVFQTVSSRVSADPDGEFATVSSTISAAAQMTVKTEPPKAAPGLDRAALLATLRAPESLRTAVILREVLGPPVSLRP